MVYQVKSLDDFNTKLKEAGGKLVVVDFFAEWCGPCKMIAPKLEGMSNHFTEVVFLKVDVDECEDIAQQYEINCMPTFVFIKNQNKIDEFSGASDEKLKALVQKHAA
uniref:Thioredoxin n=1 Tax=Hemiscolopendra marginata TaxID=943146 RepID=A0A646QFW7_9MYRI